MRKIFIGLLFLAGCNYDKSLMVGFDKVQHTITIESGSVEKGLKYSQTNAELEAYQRCNNVKLLNMVVSYDAYFFTFHCEEK